MKTSAHQPLRRVGLDHVRALRVIAPERSRLEEAGEDQRDVRQHEHHEDGEQDLDRLLDPSKVERDQAQDAQDHRGELELLPGDRQEAEEGVHAARDRDRDRQDIVDEQGGAGDDARRAAEELGRDDVASAARGKERNHLGIAGGNDEDGDRHEGRERPDQVRVLSGREERLLGAVAGRRQAVRPETDPGEKRN